MDVLWRNIVYSVRMLLKRPSLTIVAIIAIGLGIANTAIFSVVNTVLLRPLAGGALGLLLASWGMNLLTTYGPAGVPRLRDVGLDRNVLMFTFGIATLTGLLFGLAPALHASTPDPGHMLKDSGRWATYKKPEQQTRV